MFYYSLLPSEVHFSSIAGKYKIGHLRIFLKKGLNRFFLSVSHENCDFCLISVGKTTFRNDLQRLKFLVSSYRKMRSNKKKENGIFLPSVLTKWGLFNVPTINHEWSLVLPHRTAIATTFYLYFELNCSELSLQDCEILRKYKPVDFVVWCGYKQPGARWQVHQLVPNTKQLAELMF